ncbi:MAG TPA: sialidase family protein [Thermoleophilaceae bacterium]
MAARRPRGVAGRVALLALVAALLVPPAAPARTVRVFAVGPKLDLAWLESRTTFHDKLLALTDRRLRGPGAPPVQDGADDVASHLLGPADPARPVETARDLVAWPEDLGLFAALTGERSAPARGSGSLEGAIVTLIGLYPQQTGYYSSRYPGIADRVPQVRLLELALTDTFARTVVETYAEIADRYDVWLTAGVNMAQDWQVVCRDRDAFNAARPPRLPGGVLCQEESPDKVSVLGDPFEPGRDYAYEAVTSRASNMALVFDPAGRLVSRQVKEYTTPVELPGQLDLVPGEVSGGLEPLRTPVGTLGFVTSKDAWMPDVVSKLDQGHVDVLVQPEFFVNDLVGPEGMWAPDTLRASGYSDLLRHPSIETLVLPELTGNVFDFSADAQQHIAVEPRGRAATREVGFLAGQPPGPGLADVMPWVVPDPIRRGEPFAERRRRLAEAGLALRPGSGVPCADPGRPAPCENGHPEGTIHRDVTVDRRPRRRRYRGPLARTRFSRSRPVAPSKRPQRNAAVAVAGRRVLLAYEERRGGRDQVAVVRSGDGGRTWSRPVHPTGRRAGATDEWWPAVALGPSGRATVAWVDSSTGRRRVHYARSRDGGRTFAKPRPIDPSPPSGVAQWRPALAQGRGDLVHAAFVDERERSADDDLPQAHVYYSRIRRGRAEAARRLDTGAPLPLAAKHDNSWAPRVAARGDRVLIAWIDFLRYDWDVLARESTDGGATFGDQRDVSNAPEDDPATAEVEQAESLADSPHVALGARAPLVAWTDWRKRDSTATRPHQAYDTYVAAPGGRNRQADPYGSRPVSTFSPSICTTRGDDALVAFQDASRGHGDVRVRALRGGVPSGPALRVDDTGARAIGAWRPELGCSGDRVLAVWEDERDGPPQVYAARSRAGRLGGG